MLWRRNRFVVVLAALLCTACSEPEKAAEEIPGRYYTGNFLGQPYAIDQIGDSVSYRKAIDSLLHEVESACNLSDPSSVLSLYNAHQEKSRAFVFYDSSGVFGAVYSLARDLNRSTRGIYDPTMNPIRKAWKERKAKGWKKGEPDLDELFRYTVFDGAKIDLNELTNKDGYTYAGSLMRKADPRIELDFTSLAGPYGMDRIASLFLEKEVPQWKITFGRSVRVSGALPDSLGILPMGISGDESDQRIRLARGAYAYRNPLDKQDMIDPTYGYPPSSSNAVFTGVYAPTMAEANIYAEAFMIMGFEDAANWIDDQPDGRIQTFMLLSRGGEITSASTAGFDQMLMLGEDEP